MLHLQTAQIQPTLICEVGLAEQKAPYDSQPPVGVEPTAFFALVGLLTMAIVQICRRD